MRFPGLVSCVLCLAACSGEPTATGGGTTPAANGDAMAAMQAAIAEIKAAKEISADAVTVQHVLISFAGAGTKATRSKQDAEQLAAKVLQEAKAGSDFDALVKQYTDDSPPGIYGMVLDPRKADMSKNVFPRNGMVAAFGDVGWRLQVGGIGIAPHEPTKSPFGWHIIKRIK